MTDRRYQALDLAIKAGEPKRADEFYLWLETGQWDDGEKQAPAAQREGPATGQRQTVRPSYFRK